MGEFLFSTRKSSVIVALIRLVARLTLRLAVQPMWHTFPSRQLDERSQKFQSGEIVTAERAALEAMAEQPCRAKYGECCRDEGMGMDRWCPTCLVIDALDAIDNGEQP